MLLVPTWYGLILLGYAAMYWALGVGKWFTAFHLSGSSLFTLGLDTYWTFWVAALIFSEAMLGLMLVALLIAYLPTMYSAFSPTRAGSEHAGSTCRDPAFRIRDAPAFQPHSWIGKISRLLEELGSMVCGH